MQDEFGDRMKSYEAHATQHTLLPMLPVAVRIDGRAFHTFTRGCVKPFDENLAAAFGHATTVLMKETNAVMGYTQSDEINLILYFEDYRSLLPFGGKTFKLTSVLASIATGAFNSEWRKRLTPDKADRWSEKYATFDCRVWQLPNKQEAANTLLWREKDARRNSISSAAISVFSEKQLHEKTSAQKLEMLREKQIDWATHYPKWARCGEFYRKERRLSSKDVEHVPKEFQTHALSTTRDVIAPWPYELAKIANRAEVVCDRADPILLSTSDKAPE